MAPRLAFQPLAVAYSKALNRALVLVFQDCDEAAG